MTFAFSRAERGRRRLARFIPPGHRRNSVSVVLATVAINVLALAFPILMLQTYTRVIANPGTGTLFVLVTGVLVAIGLEVVLRLCRAYFQTRNAARYDHLMSGEAMARMLGAAPDSVRAEGVGRILQRMSATCKLKDVYSGQTLTMATDIAFVPVYLAAVAMIAGPLVIVPLSILVLFVVLAIGAARELRKAIAERSDADDARFSFLMESLQGCHTVKAAGLESIMARRYERFMATTSFASYHVTQQTSALFNNSAAFANIMLGSIATVGAVLTVNGVITAASLVASLLIAGRTMQPFQRAVAFWIRYQSVRHAKDELASLMAMAQLHDAAEVAPADLPKAAGRLVLSNVRGVRGATPIFRDLGLTVEPGEAVHISGVNGSDKSLLLSMLAGVQRAEADVMTLDGLSIDEYPQEILARRVGLLRDKAALFSGSIRDNITCFGRNELEAAQEVTALLGVDQDVAALAGGFETHIISPALSQIPPGLAQRIAIARALAPKPRVILFDGAETGLDRRAYSALYSLLARIKGQATMILVTNDDNITNLADRHLHLSHGQLIAVAQPAIARTLHPYHGGLR